MVRNRVMPRRRRLVITASSSAMTIVEGTVISANSSVRVSEGRKVEEVKTST